MSIESLVWKVVGGEKTLWTPEDLELQPNTPLARNFAVFKNAPAGFIAFFKNLELAKETGSKQAIAEARAFAKDAVESLKLPISKITRFFLQLLSCIPGVMLLANKVGELAMQSLQELNAQLGEGCELAEPRALALYPNANKRMLIEEARMQLKAIRYVVDEHGDFILESEVFDEEVTRMRRAIMGEIVIPGDMISDLVVEDVDPRAALDLAMSYFTQKEYAKAISILENEERYVTEAKILLGFCYRNGLGVPEDEDKSDACFLSVINREDYLPVVYEFGQWFLMLDSKELAALCFFQYIAHDGQEEKEDCFRQLQNLSNQGVTIARDALIYFSSPAVLTQA